MCLGQMEGQAFMDPGNCLCRELRPPPPKLDLSPRQSLSSQGLGRWDLDLELLLKAYQVCIWACPFLAPLPPLPFS